MPTPTRSPSDRLIVPLRRLAARELPQTDAQLLGSFVRHRDPAAFEAIVRRHGPMVYGVCRRVVGHAPDADDAFQAVFVVLARRAGSVHPREKLADFLFGVAYRTAQKARARLARRRSREKQVDAMPDVAARTDPWSDLQPVIDQELAALPDTLRLPVLLCDLEGRTQREAAAHLKLPPATLATRLASARRKLAERLSARGITLAGGALAAVLTANAAKAVPTPLVGSASGSALAAVGLGSGVVPANVLELSEGVLRMIATNKLKLVTAVLAAMSLLAGGSVGLVKADEPKPAAKARIGPTLDDKAFLTKTCETLRGSPPTPAEMGYFLTDQDTGKRKKVVTWLTEEPTNAPTHIWLTASLGNLEAQETPLRLNLNTSPATGMATSAVRWLSRLDSSADVEFVAVSDEVKPGAKPEPPRPSSGTEPHATQDLTLQYSAIENLITSPTENDSEFLKRVIESARGGKPTRIEQEYFLADKDAKKREKLLDQLLKDPAVAKKVGPEWKLNMLNPPLKLSFVYVANVGTPWADKLIDELLTKKKSDEQILEALTLAATGRMPTDTEKKLATAMVTKQKDRKAAWQEVAGTLAGTDEAKKHAERLKPNISVLNVQSHLREVEVRPTQSKPAEPKK